MLIQKIERVNSMTIRKMANEELSQCVELHLFSVLPDKRYGGVGAKCLEFAKNEVFSMGGTVLNAGAIHQSVSVRNWYEKNGFKQKEIHRAAYLPFALGIMSCNVGE